MNKISAFALTTIATLALAVGALVPTTATNSQPAEAWASWDSQQISQSFTTQTRVSYLGSTTEDADTLTEAYSEAKGTLYVIHDSQDTNTLHVFAVQH